MPSTARARRRVGEIAVISSDVAVDQRSSSASSAASRFSRLPVMKLSTTRTCGRAAAALRRGASR